MADRRARAKAGLTRAKVLEAGLALVERDGLAALSMRKLGAELGVEAMTLYYYVPNRAALLDGMVERVLDLALAEPEPGLAPAEWVRGFALSLHAVLVRYPGVLPVLATRPVSSPGALRAFEHGLATLRAAGLPLDRAVDLLNAVAVFVIGHTLAEVGRTPGHEDTEPDLTGPDLAEFPNVAEMRTAGAGLDFDRRLRDVLTMLITGYLG